MRPSRVRRLRIRQAVQVTTLVAGVALLGVTIVLAAHKDVTLVVGGEPLALSTTTSSVGELLVAEGIPLGSGLQVEPPPATSLADGMTVVVSPPPGLPPEALAPLVDPTDVGVWVVERADEVPHGKAVTGSIEAQASAIAVGQTSVVSVEVVVPGKVHDVLTNASTIGSLLSAMGIKPDADDRVAPPPSTPLQPGMRVRFASVSVVVDEVTVKVPPGVTTRYTSTLSPGQVQVETAGVPGLARQLVLLRIVNGEVTGREVLSSAEVRAPVEESRVSGPLSPTSGSVTEPGTGARTQHGVATWYDPPWPGMTAAHPFLPFGTRVTVTAVGTGRSVTVVIDDRGPFSPGRIIDLSPEAFELLAPLSRGVLDVRISW